MIKYLPCNKFKKGKRRNINLKKKDSDQLRTSHFRDA